MNRGHDLQAKSAPAFFDLHSHVVPSGDDGVATVAEGLELLRQAAARGTSVVYATPHVWPNDGLSAARERAVRAAHAEMAPRAGEFGLELRLGFELTPAGALFGEDPRRYRLSGLPAVLMELPFSGPLGLAVRLAEHIESAELVPVIGHPERAEAVLERPEAAKALRERGWLLQANATSLLGRHGRAIEATAWRLVERGLVDLVASDGHGPARPPFLDEAFGAAWARVGEERARPLFDGSAVLGLVAAPANTAPSGRL